MLKSLNRSFAYDSVGMIHFPFIVKSHDAERLDLLLVILKALLGSRSGVCYFLRDKEGDAVFCSGTTRKRIVQTMLNDGKILKELEIVDI